jgi:hypothetical protein
MSTSDAFSCSTRASRSPNNSKGDVRLLQGTHNKYSASWHRHTFVFLAQRLVLPDQLIALHLHILHFIVVLGEGTIEFGLEHGRVLPGLGEFFLQCLGPEHHVAEPLEHAGLLSGPLHDILQKGINYLGTRSDGTRLLKGTVTYLHPLLDMPHRLHVASHHCRADEIIRQKLESTPTSRCGLGHRRPTDWLRIMDSW